MFHLIIFCLVWMTCFNSGVSRDGTKKPFIKISSGGATFPLDIYKIWRPMYLSHRSTYSDIAMSYEAVGSGTGIKRFNQKLYDFAGSDIVLPESSYNNFTDDIQMFPTMAGPVSISYNIPDLPKACADYTVVNNSNCLNLTREAIIGIFNGSIKEWNDPIIVEYNSALKDLNVSITVVVRADSSGTTQLFTSALAAFNSDWKENYGSFSEGCTNKEKPIKWNSTLNIRCGSTSYGVTGLILNTPYSIGYCSTSEAHDSALPETRILNRANRWINPSVDATQAAMDSFADALGNRLTGSIVNSPAQNAYPIAGYTYFLIRKRSMDNCTIAQEILRFFMFVLTDPLAKSVVRDLIKAPVSDHVFSLINSQVFQQMECGGVKVTELVRVAIAFETGADDMWKVPVAVCLSILLVILIVVGLSFGYIQYLRNRNVLKGTYIVQIDTSDLAKHLHGSFTSSVNSGSRPETSYSDHKNFFIRTTSGEKCIAKALCKHFDAEMLHWNTRKLLVQMKHELQHANVVKVFGIAKRENEWKLVTSWARKGRLQDVMHAGKYNLSSGVRYSIANDIAEGMTYLHKYEIIHGQLTSNNCYIDGRWNSQVGDWEQNVLHHAQKVQFTAFESFYRSVYDSYPKDVTNLDEYCRLLYSSASEVLEQDSKNLFYVTSASKAGDVHSFGIIAYEVFGSLLPFDNFTVETDSKWEPLNVVTAIKAVNIRPSIPDEMRSEFPVVADLMQNIWAAEPHDRPTFLHISKVLRSANPKSESVVDTMMQAVESYAVNLEEKIAERTNELEKITQNMKNLLYNMLPPSIADKLSVGEQVEPEYYESVTLLFTDIVGFTSIAALSSALQIVDLLNDLYTTFDSVISHYDVYKVETIGDSYMCISGLPRRNGDEHAPEIATMALDILNVVSIIPIRHMPGKALRVRAGAHSGGVMAGVVGLKMPRYCLFGDTVNTAARMESSSLPMRIQISEETKKILDGFKVYKIHLRGAREVKGKGTMITFWLTGKEGYTKELPEFDPNADNDLLSMLDKSQIK